VIWCVLQCGIVFQCVETWLTNANLLRDACFFHHVLCHYVVVMAITVMFVAQIMHCDKYVATAHWDVLYVERHSKIVFLSVTWYVNCRQVSSPNVILFVPVLFCVRSEDNPRSNSGTNNKIILPRKHCIKMSRAHWGCLVTTCGSWNISGSVALRLWAGRQWDRASITGRVENCRLSKASRQVPGLKQHVFSVDRDLFAVVNWPRHATDHCVNCYNFCSFCS